jgi:hypothetical protein
MDAWVAKRKFLTFMCSRRLGSAEAGQTKSDCPDSGIVGVIEQDAIGECG